MTRYNQDIENKMLLYYSHLGEKSKRRYASLESSKLGRGGKSYIVNLLNITHKTIRKADREFLNPNLYESIGNERQRRKGGGRKKNQQ